MTQPPGSRRAFRDLLPATLATGAAGLVVSVLVGGTTQGLGPVLRPDRDPAVLTAADLAGGVSPSASGGVTVRVRPGLPAPLGIVSFLDLVPAGRAAAESEPVVRGAFFDRAATSGPTAAGATPTPAAGSLASAPALASEAPAVVAAADATSRRSPRPKRSSKSDKGQASALTAAGSTERRALGDSSAGGATDADADADADAAKRKSEGSSSGPPPHAPARGRR